MAVFDTNDTLESNRGTRVGWTRTLGAILQQSEVPGAVMRGDLSCGDRVLITTRNSVYSLWVLGDGKFAVSGGWFDKQDSAPATVTINGCTYGGSVICHDVVAARGLFLEFGNNVSTTRIRKVRVVRMKESLESETPALFC